MVSRARGEAVLLPSLYVCGEEDKSSSRIL